MGPPVAPGQCELLPFRWERCCSHGIRLSMLGSRARWWDLGAGLLITASPDCDIFFIERFHRAGRRPSFAQGPLCNAHDDRARGVALDRTIASRAARRDLIAAGCEGWHAPGPPHGIRNNT